MNIKLLKAQSILQEALQEALFDLEDNRIKNIAVTRVECTQGKELARVFLDKNSLGDMGATNALKLLKKASGAIRANLQAQLSWYKTPSLVFEIDDSLEKINKLESIFKKIHNKEKNSSLGAPCGDFGNLGRFADAKVQSHAPNSQKTPQIPPQILELDSSESESSLRGNAEAIQKNNNVDCHDSAFAESRNDSIESPQDEFAKRNLND